MAGEFEGKVVMITGAGGNLGRAAVEVFAAQGAALALVDRSPEALAPYLDALGISAERWQIAPADLNDTAQVDALVSGFEARFGHIDVLAHTVGGYAAGEAVHEASVDVWEKMMNLNARPVFITCGRVARHMVAQGVAGKIVVVLARAALRGTARHAAYNASKAAAQRIVESMAAELRAQGITVNAVLPGTIDTPQNRQATPDADYSKWVQPRQIAEVMAFLASERASAISGDSVEVYGRS